MFFFLFTSLIIVQEQSLEVASNDGITRVGELLDLHVFKSIGVCSSLSLSSSSFIFYSSSSLPPFFSFLFYFGADILFILTYLLQLGQTLIDLGSAYQATNCLIGNQTAIFRMILFPADHPNLAAKHRPSSAGLQNSEKVLREAKERFKRNKQAEREDKRIIEEELDLTFDLMIFACQFGREYVQHVWEQGKEKVSTNLPLPSSPLPIHLLLSPLSLPPFSSPSSPLSFSSPSSPSFALFLSL